MSILTDRIWKFTIMIVSENAWYARPPGSWCVSLSLQEFSPPTWFDGYLVLPNSDKPLHIRSKQMMEAARNDIPAMQIIVALGDSPDFATLQYSCVVPFRIFSLIPVDIQTETVPLFQTMKN